MIASPTSPNPIDQRIISSRSASADVSKAPSILSRHSLDPRIEIPTGLEHRQTTTDLRSHDNNDDDDDHRHETFPAPNNES